jgi:hypothetical protein
MERLYTSSVRVRRVLQFYYSACRHLICFWLNELLTPVFRPLVSISSVSAVIVERLGIDSVQRFKRLEKDDRFMVAFENR